VNFHGVAPSDICVWLGAFTTFCCLRAFCFVYGVLLFETAQKVGKKAAPAGSFLIMFSAFTGENHPHLPVPFPHPSSRSTRRPAHTTTPRHTTPPVGDICVF